MADLPRIINKVFNQPLLVTPEYLALVAQLLSTRAGVEKLLLPAETEVLAAGAYYTSRQPRKERTTQNGAAIIPVMGSLAQRDGFAMSTSTAYRGYNAIKADVDAAMSDADVSGLFFDIDSNGGEVAGNFDLSNYLNSIRGDKPMWGMVNEHAYSAAYSIASAMDRIIVPQSGGVGSIGVVMAHMNHEQYLKDAGVEVTYIYAGDHKVDGNPTEGLSKEVRADFQAKINYHYKGFTELVAQNRGMQVADVVATQARTYDAPEAVQRGLADAVMTSDDAFAEFSELIQGASRSTNTGRTTMTEKVDTPASAEDDSVSAADVETIKADAYQAGVEAGMTAERERATAILTSAEAEGREAVAMKWALSGMAAEQAVEGLTAVPKQEAVKAAQADDEGNVLDDAIEKAKADNDDVSNNVDAEADEDKTAAEHATLLEGAFGSNIGGRPHQANAGGKPVIEGVA